MYPHVTKIKSTIYSFIICMRSSLMPHAFLLRVIPCPINLVQLVDPRACSLAAASPRADKPAWDVLMVRYFGRPYLSIHYAGCPKSAKSNHSRTISWRYDSKNHERMSLSYFFPWNQSETFVTGMQKLILTPRIFLPPSCGNGSLLFYSHFLLEGPEGAVVRRQNLCNFPKHLPKHLANCSCLADNVAASTLPGTCLKNGTN